MINLETFAPRRILVCQLRQLGDVVLTTPALELLRKRYPQAELHLLTESKCLPLLENNPHVDHVWGLNKKSLTPLTKEVAWYWRVARTGYDLVVDFQQLPRCRWVVAFSGATVRLAATAPWYTRPLYTHTAPVPNGYAAESKAGILAPLGIRWTGEKPHLYLTETERTNAHALLASLGLQSGQSLITLDPTHRRETRRWPMAHYAEMIRLLHEARPQLRFLPLWGPGEEDDIRTLVSMAPPSALLLPDHMLSLREMIACIAAAQLHIGNCSAPRHVAVAVDTPTLVVLGSTSTGWTYPSAIFGGPDHRTVAANLPCQPCNRNTCPHCRCLTDLSPEVVANEVMKGL